MIKFWYCNRNNCNTTLLSFHIRYTVQVAFLILLSGCVLRWTNQLKRFGKQLCPLVNPLLLVGIQIALLLVKCFILLKVQELTLLLLKLHNAILPLLLHLLPFNQFTLQLLARLAQRELEGAKFGPLAHSQIHKIHIFLAQLPQYRSSYLINILIPIWLLPHQ
jgi:hypothetical protein